MDAFIKSPSPENQQLPGPIPTGSLWLDLSLGNGGLPRGKFVEIYGPATSGKSTLCQSIISEAQQLGLDCAYIDVDHTFDIAYAQRCGVNPETLYFSDPENAEQALDITHTLATSGAVSLIVVDSVSALITSAELKTPMGEITADTSQELLSATLRRLSATIRNNATTIIFTNQVNPTGGAIYHKLATNTARLALKLQSTIRLELAPAEPIPEENGEHTWLMRIKIVKNSPSPCLQSLELDIMYNDGIVKTGEIFDLGVQANIITVKVDQQGPTIRYKDTHLGANRREVQHFLELNPKVSKQIEWAIRHKEYPAVPLDGPES